MSESNDNKFKDFLKNNTKTELKKPVNEFNQILNKIEEKPKFGFFQSWKLAGVFSICLVCILTFSFINNNSDNYDPELMAFLTDDFDDSIYDENSEDEIFVSLIE